MKRFQVQKLSVLGMGMMGTSLALASRKRRLAREVVGFDAKPAHLKEALKLGAIDQGHRSLQEACRGASLIVLASPFASFEGLLKRISKLAPKDCLVSDLGSVKGSWVQRWERAAHPLQYLGAHPMAGSEKSGAQHAHANLFVNAPCILTPSPKSSSAAQRTLSAFWRALGAKLYLRSPQDHDRIVASFSHVTHLLAFAQAKMALESLDPKDFALAGPSFWAIARLAASNSELWSQIFVYNHEAIGPASRKAVLEAQRLMGLRGEKLKAELKMIRGRILRVRP